MSAHHTILGSLPTFTDERDSDSSIWHFRRLMLIHRQNNAARAGDTVSTHRQEHGEGGHVQEVEVEWQGSRQNRHIVGQERSAVE